MLAAAESEQQGKLAEWNFDDGAEGWKAKNQCELFASDGVLRVRSTGNDPFMGAPVEGPAGWKTITIRAKFKGVLNSQLFWTTKAEPGTSEATSVRFKLMSRGKEWAEQTIYFKTTSPLTGIRFDPHSAPLKLEIDSIQVRASSPPPAEPATDPAGFKVLPGFQVELLYSVPKQSQGSWVSMTVDPKGRLIVCDQYGGLYRVTPSRISKSEETKVEPLDVNIGEAQGLLYAFDSLYVMVNRGGKYASGLYRLRDTNGDDRFDELKTLKLLQGGGEHGPHSIVPSPDGKSLYVVAGNSTKLPGDVATYRLPKNWDEDQLLPRAPCSNGHNTGVLAPGGWVCKVDPEGKRWELVAAGFRNPYDLAFNRDGELFTFDADMEMDVGTPWYRPTRVCHVVSGAEFGWRFGTGKWPAYFPDSLPAVVDVGQGSPTGITFGYGSNFPHKYQQALFINDWTYGRLYAVHLTPQGASFSGELEEFIAGTPLPLTDILINPVDHSMYFAIGGRRTQSGLYRVTWAGDPQPNSEAATSDVASTTARERRRRLEEWHEPNPQALKTAWHFLDSPDRHLRYAARIAIEHQEVSTWRDRALTERNPDAAIQSLLALARCGAKEDGEGIVKALYDLDTLKLTERQQTDRLRAMAVSFVRQGPPNKKIVPHLATSLTIEFPAKSAELNYELCRLLVYLDSLNDEGPNRAPESALKLMKQSRTQEDLLSYAMKLRTATRGWSDDLRREYFSLLNKAETAAATGDYIGGGHLQIYVQRMRADAAKLLSDVQRERLNDVLKAELASAVPTGSPTPRKFVRNWQIDDLLAEVDRIGEGRSYEVGRQMFIVASCAQCHRFNNTGGILGPDITAAAKRYSRPVMLREILDPSKQISDQFRTHVIVTSAGKIFEGRILDKNDQSITVAVDPRGPTGVIQIPADAVDETVPSKVSMMPKDLLNTLSKEEILDLLAYIESGGDEEHANFQK
jgi:putative heme-binding domain-containing protein